MAHEIWVYIIFIRWLIKRRKNNKKNNIDSNLMSHEIHALERARTMMYDKKNELSIRDTIKKKEKKIKQKIKNEPPIGII